VFACLFLKTLGVGSTLDTLFHCLCDDSDGVLLPGPLYPTFINDLQARCNVAPIVVPTCAANDYFPTVEDLENAANRTESRGTDPRVLLLTNPSNPLGTVADPVAYAAAISWAVERGLHVVSDEIYACSIFGDGLNPFVSAWDVECSSRSAIEQQVHVVYGLAKDFGVSGLRVGALASRNAELLELHSNLGYFSMIPNPIQAQVAEILNDKPWVREFLQSNVTALRNSYEQLTAALDRVGVPYVPGGASMFLWVDLRGALPSRRAEWEDERALFERMCEKGILLTPGQDCFAEEPGFFRACWAASPPEAHATAAERIASFLEE